MVKRLPLFSAVASLFCLAIYFILTAAARGVDRIERYRPGDWVTFGVTRYVNAVSVGPQYTYFGSSEGLLRYDFFATPGRRLIPPAMAWPIIKSLRWRMMWARDCCGVPRARA